MGEYVNLSASSQTLAATTAHSPSRRAVGTNNVCVGEVEEGSFTRWGPVLAWLESLLKITEITRHLSRPGAVTSLHQEY